MTVKSKNIAKAPGASVEQKKPQVQEYMRITQQDLQALDQILCATKFEAFRDGLPLQNWLVQVVQRGTVKVES